MIPKIIQNPQKLSYYFKCAWLSFSSDDINYIVKQIPTLIDKKMDLFSSKVNQKLNGI